MSEAYSAVLEHFFLYNTPYIVYKPKVFKVKMKIIIVLFLIRKWHGYVYLK